MSESKNKKVLAAIVLATLVALPAIAEKPAPAPQAATLSVAPGGLSWSPRVSFDKLVLTVQGGDLSITEEFTTGEPYFAPVDDEGYALPDGTYTWELTVAPPALDANRETYRSAEWSADGRSMKEGQAPEGLIQSGSFTIVNGAIVDPNLAEPRSAGPQPTTRAAAAADVDDSDEANQ